MKNLSLAIALVLLMAHVNGQQLKDTPVISNKTIVGVWQAGTAVVGSALHANFQFYKEGKFVYNTNSYNDLNPLISITGVYKIEENTLCLKIRSFKQLTGFKVDEASHGFESGSFSIIGGKVQTIKQNDSTYSWHEMKIITGKKTKAIKIDNEVYYKVYSNPDEGSK